MAVVGINSYVPPTSTGTPASTTAPATATTVPAPATPQPTAVAAAAGSLPLNTSGSLGTTVNIVV